MSMRSCRNWFRVIGVVIIVVVVMGGWIAYDRGFREHPQPDWVTADFETRFKYGSIGAEHDAGIPYWIFYVLPRVFPEKLTQDGKVLPGGYAALGVPWEQGQELPAGFSKKTIGFPRVANNCAVCHTTSYRESPDANPVFVVGGPAHTTNVEGFFRYLIDCAKDPRFNADILMAEINRVTDLDFIDKLLYRFLIIPITKKRLLEREATVRLDLPPRLPRLGPRPRRRHEPHQVLHDPRPDGRHLSVPPTCRRCGTSRKYVWDKGHRMNYAGDSHDAYSVIMDSALGLLGAAPANKEDFVEQVQWLHGYLSRTAAAEVPVRHRRRQGGRGQSRCSTPTAPAAMPANSPAGRCPWPTSAPTAAASIPGTRAPRSRPIRSSRKWASNGAAWSRRT
jgi:hypothetical protein